MPDCLEYYASLINDLREREERAMGIDVKAIEKEEVSPIDELLVRFKQEVERQNNAVESIHTKTQSVRIEVPANDMLSEAVDIQPSSRLVNQLRDILGGFAANTNRLFSIADRIEL